MRYPLHLGPALGKCALSLLWDYLSLEKRPKSASSVCSWKDWSVQAPSSKERIRTTASCAEETSLTVLRVGKWVTGVEFRVYRESKYLMSIMWYRASLVAQWLRICLPMQGTRVWSLVREDPTCCRATKPRVLQLLSLCAATTEACVPRAHALQQEKPPQ